MKKQDPMDRLLRRQRHALDHGAPASACLDAETIAAWEGGALPAGRRAAAEAHAADCDRCLAIVAALATTEPARDQRWFAWWLPLRWLVPATAAATALLLWVMVERPADRGTPSGAPAGETLATLEPVPRTHERGEPLAPSPVPPGVAGLGAQIPAGAPRDGFPTDAAPSAPQVPAKPPSVGGGGRPPADTQEHTRARDTSLAETVAAPQPKAAREAVEDLSAGARSAVQAPGEPLDIVSPDPARRWRLVGTAVERSTDGGATWHSQAVDAAAPLLAGAAPSTTICWVAGASGTILRTVDGTAWVTVPFPEPVDLVAVIAADARTASVTAADGRVFHTADGGLSWSLQETPASPF
jgi:hypothetical protein